MDFENIAIEDVNYLTSTFDGIAMFILYPIDLGVLDAYGKAMESTGKIYNGHAW